MSEKRRPHYALTEVKRLVRSIESRRITRSALDGAAALSSLRDRTLWQDVYRPNYGGVPLYVKVQIVGERMAVVISFKAL